MRSLRVFLLVRWMGLHSWLDFFHNFNKWMGCGPQLRKSALRERNSNFKPCKPEVSATTLCLLTYCLKSQIHALKIELFLPKLFSLKASETRRWSTNKANATKSKDRRMTAASLTSDGSGWVNCEERSRMRNKCERHEERDDCCCFEPNSQSGRDNREAAHRGIAQIHMQQAGPNQYSWIQVGLGDF